MVWYGCAWLRFSLVGRSKYSQICLEGEISKKTVMSELSRGKRASGDLIPWTMAQQYQVCTAAEY